MLGRGKRVENTNFFFKIMDCPNLKMDTRVKHKDNVTYMFESMLLSNYF